MKQEKWTGWILLFLGFLLLSRQMHWVSFSLSSKTLAGLFLFALYMKQGGKKYYENIGLLIPSMILLLLGLKDQTFLNGFIIVSRNTTVGLAFLLVYLIHTVHFKTASFEKRYWPFITGLILISRQFIPLRIGSFSILPLILIGIGIYIVGKDVRQERKQDQESPEDIIDYRDQYSDHQ